MPQISPAYVSIGNIKVFRERIRISIEIRFEDRKRDKDAIALPLILGFERLQYDHGRTLPPNNFEPVREENCADLPRCHVTRTFVAEESTALSTALK